MKHKPRKPQRTRLYRKFEEITNFPVECNPYAVALIDVEKMKIRRIAKLLVKGMKGT